MLEALTSNPQVWGSTALFVTYDENDGFFDHVVPPFPAPSPAQGASTVDTTLEQFHPAPGDPDLAGPYGLGQRVPMFVVSPWSKGGFVCSQTFDHTSILRFMEARFGVHEPNITPWRRVVCGDLTAAFGFAHADAAVPSLPDTGGFEPPDENRHPSVVPAPPANPMLPTQEPGVHPARSLPCDLVADGRVDTGSVRIEFANPGAVGANYLVTTVAAGPWSYTVEPAKSLTGEWKPTGSYDLTVHGPNGFFRQFKGSLALGPDVTARHNGSTGQVQLVLTNFGGKPVRLTVTDAYGGRFTHRRAR